MITTEINHGIYLILYPFAQPTLCILIDGMESIPAARRIAGSVTVFTYGAGTDLYPGFQGFYTFIEMTDDFCDIIPAPLGKVASFTVLPEIVGVGKTGSILRITQIIEMDTIYVIFSTTSRTRLIRYSLVCGFPGLRKYSRL